MGQERLPSFSDVVVDALGETPKGVDDKFMAMHRLFKFSTEDDTVAADAVVFAVATDDAAMLRRAQGLWPLLTAEEVAEDCPTLAKWVVEGAGRSVLAELRHWWGVRAMRKVISARLSMDNAHVDWEEARHLADVLVFLNEIGVPFAQVLRSNNNLVADVVACGGGDAGVVAVLRLLRTWGMRIKDVRECEPARLWRELSLSAAAITELATWGLKAREALVFKGGVVVDWEARNV